MSGCWTDVKQRRKNGQSIGNVTKACRGWRTSHGQTKKKLEEALPRLQESDLENASRLARQRQEWDATGFHPKVPLDLTKETRVEVVELLEFFFFKKKTKWKISATSLHGDVLFGPEESYN